MKSVESVALSLMMVMVFVSASPLPPPPPSHNKSRHDDQSAVSLHLLNNKEETSTRFESRQSDNSSLLDFPRVVKSNATTNETSFRPFMHGVTKLDLQPDKLTYQRNCILSTCLTANLGSSLQGGDETAGGATTDPFGIGKK